MYIETKRPRGRKMRSATRAGLLRASQSWAARVEYRFERSAKSSRLRYEWWRGGSRRGPHGPPAPRGLIRREVLRGGEAGPRAGPDPLRELPRQRHRLVGGLGIDHEDLVGPLDALEARPESLLLVPRDDRDRQPRPRPR